MTGTKVEFQVIWSNHKPLKIRGLINLFLKLEYAIFITLFHFIWPTIMICYSDLNWILKIILTTMSYFKMDENIIFHYETI